MREFGNNDKRENNRNSNKRNIKIFGFLLCFSSSPACSPPQALHWNQTARAASIRPQVFAQLMSETMLGRVPYLPPQTARLSTNRI
jgi:hypothetical protein